MESDTPYVTTRPTGPCRENIIDMLSFALIKTWFPERVPVDVVRWSEIAKMDATCVVDELLKQGLLKVSTEEE